MYGMMGDMGWMHVGMAVIGLLVLGVLAIGIAALVKYLRSHT